MTGTRGGFLLSRQRRDAADPEPLLPNTACLHMLTACSSFPLAPRSGREVALAVAQALHYLHALKIVHYDVSAGNVLLTRKLDAKLSDAGLARWAAAGFAAFLL